MARKPNYDFEKRRKEAERKAKTEAKNAAKAQRKKDIEAGLIPPDDFMASAEELAALTGRPVDEEPADEGEDEDAK